MPVIPGTPFSVVQHYLAQLRDTVIQSDRQRFRFNLRRLGLIMAYEISKTMSSESVTVQTPLGTATHQKAKAPGLIAVMRAALPYLEGFQDAFDDADTGFIGAHRIKETAATGIQVAVDYLALPDLSGRDVILIDPMLATGTSVCDSVSLLSQRGTFSSLRIATLIASPEGVRKVENTLGAQAKLWTFQVDEGLNPNAYILPGLGDAGDLSFGVKI